MLEDGIPLRKHLIISPGNQRPITLTASRRKHDCQGGLLGRKQEKLASSAGLYGWMKMQADLQLTEHG